MSIKEEVLDLIQDEIDSVNHNFPFTHDDQVKLDTLQDLYSTINDTIKD